MKQISLKIKSFLLALLFVVSSNTFAVTSHFCGSYLVDVSYIGKAASCEMAFEDDSCNNDLSFKNSCCSETIQLIESDFESLAAKNIDNFVAHKLLGFFTNVFNVNYFLASKQRVTPKNTSPPKYQKDFQVLFQTFLI